MSGYSNYYQPDESEAGPSSMSQFDLSGRGHEPLVHAQGYSPSNYVPRPMMYNSPAPQFRPPRAFPPHNDVRYVAVAAQIVYVGARIPMVARVSITDYRGAVLMDTFVHPIQPITDYRVNITGLYPADFYNAPFFCDVQRQVAAQTSDKILIGHSLWEFFSVMGFSHPAIDTRDVALFLPFRRSLRTKTMLPLSTLVEQFMSRRIGAGFELPLENARAALDLFRSCEDVWESSIRSGSWPCSLPPSAYSNHFT